MHRAISLRNRRDPHSVKPNYFRLGVKVLMGVTVITLAVAYAFVCSYVYLEPTLPTVSAMKNNELAGAAARVHEQRRAHRADRRAAPQPGASTSRSRTDRDDRRSSRPKTTGSSSITASTGRASCAALFVNADVARQRQGGSTITMQAARSAFFTQEQTVRRKLQEIFVTQRLEHEFSKQEILALYLNVIFFGQRSYGVAAAAETYFGKQLDELTLGEAATLARVPQCAVEFQPDHQSGGRGGTPRLRAAPHARARLHRRRGGRGGREGSS